jgi:hypothetical protein
MVRRRRGVGWLRTSHSDRSRHACCLRGRPLYHAVYSPEVRHPVEVGAAEQEHLVNWLSKRLGAKLRAPLLTREGYELVGGRLLPGDSGAVAQFMYQDAKGKRLTLYVSRLAAENRDTAFRFSQEDKVAVFYWTRGSATRFRARCRSRSCSRSHLGLPPAESRSAKRKLRSAGGEDPATRKASRLQAGRSVARLWSRSRVDARSKQSITP